VAGGWAEAFVRQIQWGMPLYNLLYVTLIIFFAYFYTAIIFNPDDVAENMRKYGGFMPGIRPGKRTASTSTPSWRRSRWSGRSTCRWWRFCPSSC
jgi:preprotein translocase subunit SecY